MLKQLEFKDQFLSSLLDGTKTVTRRLINPQLDNVEEPEEGFIHCDNGRICGRQRYRVYDSNSDGEEGVDIDWLYFPNNDNSMTCPYGTIGTRHKITENLILEITNISVDKIQNISYNDILDEGCLSREEFESIWNSIYGKESWINNSWVWIINFKRI